MWERIGANTEEDHDWDNTENIIQKVDWYRLIWVRSEVLGFQGFKISIREKVRFLREKYWFDLGSHLKSGFNFCDLMLFWIGLRNGAIKWI